MSAARGPRVAREIARSFIRRRPGATAAYTAALVAQTALQGAGLVLLVPILFAAGVGTEAETLSDPVARFAFDTLGLPDDLPVLLAVFVLLVAAREGTGLLVSELGTRLRVGFTTDLRIRLFSALSRASWPFVASLRTSDTQHALQSEIGAVSGAIMQLLTSLYVALTLVVFAVISVIVAPGLAAPMLLAAAAVLAVSRPLVRRSRRHGQSLLTAQRGAGATTYDQLEGMREVKSFGAEERAITRFGRQVRDAAASEVSFRRGQAAVSAILAVGAAAVLAVLAYAAVEGVTGSPVTPAALIVVVFVMARLVTSATTLAQTAQQFAHTSPAFESVHELIGRAEAAREVGADGPEPMPLTERLVLDDVRFRYAGSDADVLDGVSVTIEAGSLTVLTGRTGVGKTTLADVALGLLTPQSGRVVVDGAAVDGGNVAAWRAATAYVPQHPFLFNGTLADNLRLADPDATDDDLWAALRLAQLDARVEAMAGGLAATIGDDGHGLSGGERQRLALARALVRRPSLLVADEVTAALDPDTEARVFDALAGLTPRIAVLAIAHRGVASTIADTVLHLGDDGLTVVDRV